MKHVFIVNPKSGKADATQYFIPELIERVAPLGLDYVVEITERPHHATEIARQYAMIDGPLARRLGAVSRFGAKLDSAADTLFVFVVLVRLWPYLVLPPAAVLLIVGIALLRVGAGIVAKLRFGAFGFLHTWRGALSSLF